KHHFVTPPLWLTPWEGNECEATRFSLQARRPASVQTTRGRSGRSAARCIWRFNEATSSCTALHETSACGDAGCRGSRSMHRFIRRAPIGLALFGFSIIISTPSFAQYVADAVVVTATRFPERRLDAPIGTRII